LFEFEGTQL